MPDATSLRKMARPLEGCRIGISISESEDLSAYGLTSESINIVTVDLARRIIALGGTVLLGHDWRTGGVMEAVSRFAVSYAGQNARPDQKLIINYLADPDRPNLSALDSEMLSGIVEFRSLSWKNMPGPPKMEPLITRTGPWSGDAVERHLKAWRTIDATARRQDEDPSAQRPLDLSALRFSLAEACDVRIVLGGKTQGAAGQGGRKGGYQGFAPGIVEEAWWQILLGRRLIVCEGMGGAALAISRPEAKQAASMLADYEHPLAGMFLEAIYASREAQASSIEVVETLHVDQLLRAIRRAHLRS